ncbi:hypothetical protein M5X00_29900 [Paenibacillus alvei]|uniref:Uncharacterized protein n=1 Tax=Paenibacillus alvei TaxID=44250 RepID=A0ABT4H901_PAEAL|nr:hypothetical protein [Paenibacillus alvei]EJW14436.1 hypothetical protein PAV_13c00550 [Paenibacillus alvei DSM 29]MCY9545184.1 hypothetical protein [Paenibacillus alvei]MCY9708196.1 hypothetical protein [Paenibacillus alvei]MCY9737904.1 hypothetical protein [Paenibacillus alvei]MCY9758436.1 hypothetical protein [Paenibacillus alvei]
MSRQWYDNEFTRNFVDLVFKKSPEAFINSSHELIIEPEYNIYLGLNRIESELDLKMKVLSWLSRPSCKGVSKKVKLLIRGVVNDSLCTDFSEDEMREIYTYLGNDCNRNMSIKFIESGFDISVLGRA